MTAPPPMDGRSLRLFHLVLSAASLMMALVLIGIRTAGMDAAVAPGWATGLGAAGIAAAGGALALRPRFGPRRPSESVDGWWSADRRAPLAIVVWALGATGVDAGAIAYFLAGDVVTALPAIVLGLGVLLWSGPDRLASR
jgi:hypothetical protein